MTANDETRDIECSLLWQLARSHGWSSTIGVHELVSNANVQDEKRGREIARDELSQREFVGYHPGKDEIWLDPPPTQDLAEFLVEKCGYTRLQVETTLDSYL